MKKLILLSALVFSSLGPLSGQSVVFTHRQPVPDETIRLPRSESPAAESGSAEKTTLGNTKRWYSYFETADSFLLNLALRDNLRSIPIWQDSTVRLRYAAGDYGAINYSSVYQVMGPAYFTPFSNIFEYPGALSIRPTDTFSVDSIFIAAVYQRLPSKASVVDTLILSVTHVDSSSNFSTPFAMTVASVDSIRRTAYTGAGSSNPGLVWKVPLYYADSAINGKFYRFRVGGPASTALKIPAGRNVAITATFKTGDTWVRNVDSLSMHNSWRPITASSGDNTQMPYWWFQYRDRDMSGLMFSKDSGRYYPSVYIEGINTPAFTYEFHYMGMKTGCSSCGNLGLDDHQVLTAGQAYPNPAAGELHVPYRLSAGAEVVVEVYDLSGRKLQSRAEGRPAGPGTATVRTEELAAGSYLYLLKASGNRAGGLFCVRH